MRDFCIRPWVLSDAQAIANALNNPNIQKNLRDGLPFPYTAADARDYISATLEAAPGSQYHWAITYRDQAIGSIGVFRKDNIHHRTAEMGYYLAQEYWGKGIMPHAVRMVCSELFATTDIIRIFAEPFAYNMASRRVLEKSGFTLEGTLRKNAVKDGVVIDMCMYSILRTEAGA